MGSQSMGSRCRRRQPALSAVSVTLGNRAAPPAELFRGAAAASQRARSIELLSLTLSTAPNHAHTHSLDRSVSALQNRELSSVFAETRR